MRPLTDFLLEPIDSFDKGMFDLYMLVLLQNLHVAADVLGSDLRARDSTRRRVGRADRGGGAAMVGAWLCLL